ncbi:hypothetical protein J3R82DRAFT_8756 [Butyriboletus roseoflavus]|nr:hypothetical protein J3R82DRAFT_8756 [Butyriboletus roseoflavus]
MSPFSNILAPNHGADDLQLRVHISRESETTATPTLDSRTSSTPTLPPPRSHHSQRQLNDDALGDFFGGRGHRTRTQRREHRVPPPYSPDWDGEKLPVYTPSPDFEMETVARHLFKYGFFFPVFWAVGVYFLFAPIRVSADWESDRTEEEKEKMLSEMRATETKWAKRCLWALLSFFVKTPTMVNFAELKAKAERAKDASVAAAANTRDRYSSTPSSKTNWDPNWKRARAPPPPPPGGTMASVSTSGPPLPSRTRPHDVIGLGLSALPAYVPPPPPTRAASGYPPSHRETSQDAVNRIDWVHLSPEDKEAFFGLLDEFFSRYLGIELGPRERRAAPSSVSGTLAGLSTRLPPMVNKMTRPPV